MSYNRPRFASCAKWDSNGVTFANSSTLAATSTGLFVTTSNTVYATARNLQSVLVWPEGSASATESIFVNLSNPYRVFVTIKGDVYADDGDINHRVEKWMVNTSDVTTSMVTSGACTGLFVDVYDSLYCSRWNEHRVLMRAAGSDANISVTVAGSGTVGSAANMFDRPCGIFVDIDLSLYVADFGNNRVQLFRSGVVNGTTVAGDGAPTTIVLNGPTKAVLDGGGYLFIVDHKNSRIVGSGPRGFRCIAGCTGQNGSAANQLFLPYELSFDSHGNLYVADSFNNRIQKFLLNNDSACSGELFMTSLCIRE